MNLEWSMHIHRLDGCESEGTPGVGEGQGGLACCDSWGCKESDMTEQVIWSDLSLPPTPEHILVGKSSFWGRRVAEGALPFLSALIFSTHLLAWLWSCFHGNRVCWTLLSLPIYILLSIKHFWFRKMVCKYFVNTVSWAIPRSWLLYWHYRKAALLRAIHSGKRQHSGERCCHRHPWHLGRHHAPAEESHTPLLDILWPVSVVPRNRV